MNYKIFDFLDFLIDCSISVFLMYFTENFPIALILNKV